MSGNCVNKVETDFLPTDQCIGLIPSPALNVDVTAAMDNAIHGQQDDMNNTENLKPENRTNFIGPSSGMTEVPMMIENLKCEILESEITIKEEEISD